MDVVRIVGKDLRSWKDASGQQHDYCGLHVVFEATDQPITEGARVDTLTCPQSVNPVSLALNGLYQLDYAIYKTRDGMKARVAGFMPVEEG